jgi:GH25 family lysozyme M1 (1,4-beta-N-acetylmuramidase)
MRIDLSDFDNRKEEISKDLMKAASEHGFFYGKSFILFFSVNFFYSSEIETSYQ